MSPTQITPILVGTATAMFACLTATAQQPPNAPQKDTAAPVEATTEDQPSAEEALRLSIDAAERLEDAGGDETLDLLEKINAFTAIVHADNPINPWLDYVTGYAFAASGRKGDAIERIQTFVHTREGRNYWQAHRLLGDLLINSYPRLAKSSFVKARRLKQDDPTILYGLSRCAASAGEFATAVELAEQVVSADGGKSLSYVHFLTELFIQENRWDEAWRSARQAVSIAERDISLAATGGSAERETGGNLRAKLLLLVAEIEVSLEVLRGVIREDPAGEDAYLQMAGLTRKRAVSGIRISKIDELKILEEGVKETGDRASRHLLQAHAVALAEVGREDDAIVAFQKLLEKDPANSTATEWLIRLRQEKE
ncbi:MAG: hypothetical protein IH987_03115 [Planctomycetes bacterium]|nr:hypothetical protein [Planctomycetota bacterium]